MAQDAGYALGWDDEIKNEGQEFVTLPEGEYEFKITEWERGRYPGGEGKIACSTAVLHIQIEGPEGVSRFKETLFLNSKNEWVFCAFFVCIGLRKKGEPFNMGPAWNKVTGSMGRAKVAIRKYKNDKGEDKEINTISKWLEPAQTTQQSTYQPGKF